MIRNPVRVDSKHALVEVYDLDKVLIVSVLAGDRFYEIGVKDGRITVAKKYPDGDVEKILLDEEISPDGQIEEDEELLAVLDSIGR